VTIFIRGDEHGILCLMVKMSLSSFMIQGQPRRSTRSIYHHTILMSIILTHFFYEQFYAQHSQSDLVA